MTEIREYLSRWMEHIPSSFAAISTVGSLALYVFGYLSLRSKLSVFGVPTDLNIIDLRYLHEGTTLLLMIFFIQTGLLIIFLAFSSVSIVFYRALLRIAVFLTPSSRRGVVTAAAKDRLWHFWGYFSQYRYMAAMGIILSVVFQWDLRGVSALNHSMVGFKSFSFTSFLLSVCEFNESDFSARLYVIAHVFAVNLVSLIFFATIKKATTVIDYLMTVLFGFMLFVHILTVPVSYGYILAIRSNYPMVQVYDEKGSLLVGDPSSWFIWEGEWSISFLVVDDPLSTLVAIPKDRVARIDVTRYSNPARNTPTFRRHCL